MLWGYPQSSSLVVTRTPDPITPDYTLPHYFHIAFPETERPRLSERLMFMTGVGHVLATGSLRFTLLGVLQEGLG